MRRGVRSEARLLILALLLQAGCASLGSFPSPTGQMTAPAVRVEKAGVSVEVAVIDPDQTTDIFGVDLVRKGIQPLMMTIRNGGAQTYRFRKADVGAHYLPAAAVARHAYENPIVTGGRVAGWLVWQAPAFVFPSLQRGTRRPALRRDVLRDFTREEIADTEIGPGGSARGFLFIRPGERGQPFTVRLLNVQTQEPLVIEIPNP